MTPQFVVTKMFKSIDDRDWTSAIECFEEEVLLDYSSLDGKAPEKIEISRIIDSWKNNLGGFQYTHHQIGNMLEIADSEDAHINCYGIAMHYLENDNGSIWEVVGTYDFILECTASIWKIKEMKFNYKFQSGNSNLPALAKS